jgi:hypothetical protein
MRTSAATAPSSPRSPAGASDVVESGEPRSAGRDRADPERPRQRSVDDRGLIRSTSIPGAATQRRRQKPSMRYSRDFDRGGRRSAGSGDRQATASAQSRRRSPARRPRSSAASIVSAS